MPVLGLAKLTMKRLPEGSREQNNLLVILQAGEQARDLVQRILGFSRKEMPTRVGVNIAEVTRQALTLLRWDSTVRAIAKHGGVRSTVPSERTTPRALDLRAELSHSVYSPRRP